MTSLMHWPGNTLFKCRILNRPVSDWVILPRLQPGFVWFPLMSNRYGRSQTIVFIAAYIEGLLAPLLLPSSLLPCYLCLSPFLLVAEDQVLRLQVKVHIIETYACAATFHVVTKALFILMIALRLEEKIPLGDLVQINQR